MRERSHEKGRTYQRNVKRWLVRVPLFGASVRPHGDAYGITAQSAAFGNKQFDFSLTMHPPKGDHDAMGIVFVECKYRSHRHPAGTAFEDFLRDVVSACKAEQRERRRHVRFLFVSTSPPPSWEAFLRGNIAYLRRSMALELKDLTEDDVADMAARIFVLVLTSDLFGGP